MTLAIVGYALLACFLAGAVVALFWAMDEEPEGRVTGKGR